MYNFNPIRWFFGKGYTIFVRLCEAGGHEIHVQSSVPVRHECLKIMNDIGGVFWTSIDPSNQRAINLCLKCGFEFVTETVVSGKIKLNLYRRLETCSGSKEK